MGKGLGTFLELSVKMGMALSSRLSWVQLIHGDLEGTSFPFHPWAHADLDPGTLRLGRLCFPAKVLGQWTSKPCPITKGSSFKPFQQTSFAIFSARSEDVFHANNWDSSQKGHPDLSLTLWWPLLVPIQATSLPCSWSSFLFTPWAKKKF